MIYIDFNYCHLLLNIILSISINYHNDWLIQSVLHIFPPIWLYQDTGVTVPHYIETGYSSVPYNFSGECFTNKHWIESKNHCWDAGYESITQTLRWTTNKIPGLWLSLTPGGWCHLMSASGMAYTVHGICDNQLSITVILYGAKINLGGTANIKPKKIKEKEL